MVTHNPVKYYMQASILVHVHKLLYLGNKIPGKTALPRYQLQL